MKTMPVSLKLQPNYCSIAISGNFTFEIHRQFREYSEQALGHPGCQRLDMDLSGVDYLDSAALGMLLLLRDKTTTLGKQVRLKGATGSTLNILRTVKFDEMFDLV
jgi:anti-anti-sigma factor